MEYHTRGSCFPSSHACCSFSFINGCSSSPVAAAWRLYSPGAFWQIYECRTWQFSVPRAACTQSEVSLHGHDGSLFAIHEWICDTGAEGYPEAVVVFSASLSRSGEDLLALGERPSCESSASTPWLYGRVLEPELTRVLPWYENVRRAAKRKRDSAVTDADPDEIEN